SWCIANRMWKKKIYLRLISRRIMNHAAAIHAMAEQEALQIESFGFRAPVKTIPNGIDFDRLKLWRGQDRQVLTEALGWPAAKNHLLFLSRIHPKKGLEFLLDLFSQLSPERRDLRLMIAGPDDHEYAQQIRAIARTSPVRDRIHFLGEVLGDRKWMSLAAATAFVLPSKSENFGIAVLESLASGTPVFVSDQTPWSIVNDEGAGACLPLEICEFKNHLTDVIDEPEVLKRSTTAATKVASNFEWRAIARRNIEMYEQICGVYKTP
ncbi:MAG: glycosyltransferase, partial [Planctomycetota bacterium]|nr:glycosyltransferase [Planctomycetota bacterium]